MSDKLVTPVRVGTIDSGSEDIGKFPFDAWEFDLPSGSSPKLRIKSPWIFDAINRYADTAANLASANAVIPKGWIAFETDTLSFKIGDGTTAYTSLTYAKPDAAKAPLPQTAAGVGQFVTVNPAIGVAAVLGANGTWAYSIAQYDVNGAWVGPATQLAGIAAGGATIGAATANKYWAGWAYRIT